MTAHGAWGTAFRVTPPARRTKHRKTAPVARRAHGNCDARPSVRAWEEQRARGYGPGA